MTILFLLAGDALAHPGHGAPSLHSHGWEYLLAAAAIAAAVAVWLRAGK